MPQIERIGPQRAREMVKADEALLVYAYDDEEKCEKLRLEGSITLAELRERDVSRARQLVFYCA